MDERDFHHINIEMLSLTLFLRIDSLLELGLAKIKTILSNNAQCSEEIDES